MYHHHTSNIRARHSGYGPKGNEVLQYQAPRPLPPVTDRHIALIREAFPECGDPTGRYIVVVPLKDHLRATVGFTDHFHKDRSWKSQSKRCADGSLVCHYGWHPGRQTEDYWTILDAKV